MKALGSDLRYCFGPSVRKINIVTEGLSDRIYLDAMVAKLGVGNDGISVIAAIGAPNVANICSILFGWGCDFTALYDYDQEGVKESKRLRKHLGAQLNKGYCFVMDVSETDIVDRPDPIQVEDLIDASDKHKFAVGGNGSRIVK